MSDPFILEDGVLTVGGVDLSAWVSSVRIPREREIRRFRTIGVASERKKSGGKTWSVELNMLTDYDVAASFETLDAHFESGAAVALIFQPTTGVAAPDNPHFSGNVIVPSLDFIDAEAGDLSTFTITLEGDGDYTKVTS